MAGGRAGMKKMKVGGSAKKEKMYDVEVDGKMYKFGFDSKPSSTALKKALERVKTAKAAQKMAPQKKKMGGKVISNKEMEIFKATSPRISKERTKQMIGKAGKNISNKDKEIVAKKMGGRAGVVKMMNGGDPLSKRGIKMGMSMSPSKNKGKGLYGK